MMTAQLICIGPHGITAYEGNTRLNGYHGRSWAKELGPDTVVVDSRSMTIDARFDFAVKGPMPDVSLEPGMVSKPLDGIARPWVDDGRFGARCLDSVAIDVYSRLAERNGATVRVGRLPDDLA